MMLELLCVFIRFFTGVQVRWLNKGPQQKQRIYIANHTSHADCMVLLSVLPLPIRKVVRPAAAEEYWTATALRKWFAEKILNIVPIPRTKLTKSNNPIKRLVAALDQGSSLIIFPEGGRQDELVVKEFKCGLYHLCKERPQIEIVPTYIDNANRVLPKGQCIPIPVVCSVTFGESIHLVAGERKEDFLKRAQQAVERCAS